MHPDDARATLTEVGERRSYHERGRAEVMLDTRDAVADGIEAGLTITEIAALTGLTRPTIYKLLDQ